MADNTKNSTKIDRRLEKNILSLEKTFENCGDIVSRKMTVGGKYTAYVTYIDGMVNREFIEEQLIKNLIVRLRENPPENAAHFGEIIDAVTGAGLSSADISEIYDLESAQDAMMSGDCVLLTQGSDKGVILSCKGFPNRGVGETEAEKGLQGAKDAFTEILRFNTALIRRRIRDTNLKFEHMKIGRRSKTDIAVVYVKGIVRQSLLNEVKASISKLDIDALFDSGQLEQLIETGRKERHSPFPLTQVTERPDKTASALLEGRIAVIVDNSPLVILLPVTFGMFFQASEDYYQRPEIMSVMRIIRYIAAFMALTLPGLYIALTVYNPSMVPSSLALKMAAARESIPFPAVLEVMMMEVAFELLKEAGIRLPGPIGGTLGIVGGLIMGQAAVEAGIVSPVVVIIVALGGVASFAIPQQPLMSAFRLAKFVIIFLSSILGLFGLWFGVMAVLAHMSSLKSFGFPYMFPLGCSDISDAADKSGKCGEMKDTFIRASASQMTKRPFFANPDQKTRMTEVTTHESEINSQ